jgi:cyanophycin synthetase
MNAPLDLHRAQFFEGPNRYAGGSALLADVSIPERAPSRGASDPTQFTHVLFELGLLGRRLDLAFAAHPDDVDRLMALACAALDGLVVADPPTGAVVARDGRRATVVLPCEDRMIGLAALRLGACALGFWGTRDAAWLPVLSDAYDEFQAVRDTVLDAFTLAMVQRAVARGMPWYRLTPQHSFVQLGQGCRRHLFNQTLTDTTSAMASRLVHDKQATQEVLRAHGLPVPGHALVDDATQAVAAAGRIGYPVVVKPCRGFNGIGVTVDLRNPGDVRTAFERAVRKDARVLVEAHLSGTQYRLLVVNDRLIAAVAQTPGFVTGDGRSSVQQLLDAFNRNPRRDSYDRRAPARVAIDVGVREHLLRQGLSPGSIPAAGQRVTFSDLTSGSYGPSCADVTETVHPDNRLLAVEAARITGLDIAGIDFICPDIAQSWQVVGGGIHEVNQNPGLRPHWSVEGEPRDVVSPILEAMYPPGAPSRIPVVAVCAGAAGPGLCSAVAQAFEAAGLQTGVSSRRGVHVGDRVVREGPHANGQGARTVVMRPDVAAAVCELSPVDVATGGMVLDAVAAAIVLAVDEVAEPGVGERVIASATKTVLVLDAGDAACLDLRSHTRAGRIALVAADAGGDALQAHRAGGGLAVWCEGEALVLADAGREVLRLARPAQTDARDSASARIRRLHAACALATTHALGLPVQRG